MMWSAEPAKSDLKVIEMVCRTVAPNDTLFLDRVKQSYGRWAERTVCFQEMIRHRCTKKCLRTLTEYKDSLFPPTHAVRVHYDAQKGELTIPLAAAFFDQLVLSEMIKYTYRSLIVRFLQGKSPGLYKLVDVVRDVQLLKTNVQLIRKVKSSRSRLEASLEGIDDFASLSICHKCIPEFPKNDPLVMATYQEVEQEHLHFLQEWRKNDESQFDQFASLFQNYFDGS